MKITPGGAAIVASLLLLSSSDHEVAARQGQPEEPELEPPSPRKVSKTRGTMTGDSAMRHQQNRELRGRRSRRSSPYPRNNNYSYHDNREEEDRGGAEAEADPPTYVRRVLVPRQEQILPYRSTFP